jgi:hypothetical protein
MDRSDNTAPGANDIPQGFKMDRAFRFGTDNPINKKT